MKEELMIHKVLKVQGSDTTMTPDDPLLVSKLKKYPADKLKIQKRYS